MTKIIRPFKWISGSCKTSPAKIISNAWRYFITPPSEVLAYSWETATFLQPLCIWLSNDLIHKLFSVFYGTACFHSLVERNRRNLIPLLMHWNYCSFSEPFGIFHIKCYWFKNYIRLTQFFISFNYGSVYYIYIYSAVSVGMYSNELSITGNKHPLVNVRYEFVIFMSECYLININLEACCYV